jgi:hypothetical protein
MLLYTIFLYHKGLKNYIPIWVARPIQQRSNYSYLIVVVSLFVEHAFDMP